MNHYKTTQQIQNTNKGQIWTVINFHVRNQFHFAIIAWKHTLGNFRIKHLRVGTVNYSMSFILKYETLTFRLVPQR